MSWSSTARCWRISSSRGHPTRADRRRHQDHHIQGPDRGPPWTAPSTAATGVPILARSWTKPQPRREPPGATPGGTPPGLVATRKQGRWVFYRVAMGFPQPLREHCLRQLAAITRAPAEGDEDHQV